MNTRQVQGEKNQKDVSLPAGGEVVLVQCDGFRCMAYRDKEGQWRNYHHPKDVLDVKHVVHSTETPALAKPQVRD